jgi:hypothetical protein
LNEKFGNLVSSRAEFTPDNAVGWLNRRYQSNFDCSAEINFIASHFIEVGQSGLKTLDGSVLSQILSSSALKIECEYWLSEQIWSLVESNQSHFLFLQFVKFEFVSTEVASRFIEAYCEFVDLMDSSIWLSLGHRFV